MDSRAEILFEINNISTTVASIEGINVLKVEADYFPKLTDIILAKIAAENELFNSNVSVPDGYFESLADNIFNKIRGEGNEVTEELKKLSPLLNDIGKKEIYTVPEGYFELLAFTDENQKKSAKIISINKIKTVLKYAAAAVFTGLLGLGIVNIVDKDSVPSTVITAKINNKITNTILQTPNFDEVLQQVSDNEIEKYLHENGHDVSAALVAAAAEDADKLPEPTDYLLDENVLENYLKKNNLNN